MLLHVLLRDIPIIYVHNLRIRVERTVADEAARTFAPESRINDGAPESADDPALEIGVLADAPARDAVHPALAGKSSWMYFRARENGRFELFASHAHLLYLLWTVVAEDWAARHAEEFADGVILEPAFPRMRPIFDLLLTQYARTVRGFDREDHIRTLARLGFSSVEVNALAFPLPIEQGPPGEVLHRFYTYAPALDQFVSSRLMRGVYDADYLQANLNVLRANAALAEKYGLASDLVCFEPRSVPDAVFDRYPMLRGARVDHPLRSFRPRYTLSVAHPVVLEHYAEMVTALLHDVPQIESMSVWSNDSGAGFEYTNSLYVGRNGGGYVIREWKDAPDIAEAAAGAIIRFLRTLRDAGRTVNPRFRTSLRMEAFWAEQEHLWRGLEDGIDIEASSLLSGGWTLRYAHPTLRYAREIHLTALHNRFLPDETRLLEEIRARGADAHVYFSPGTLGNHEPLLGAAFPWLVAEKLRDMAAAGVRSACAQGGAVPARYAPCNINQEVLRAFRIGGAATDVDAVVAGCAAAWCGPELAADLVAVWRACDDAFRAYPVPVWIYSAWGVWYRTLTRPLVPDIDALPEEARAYYERFLLATAHNRARVDFRYDVGFELTDPAHARTCFEGMDREVFPLLEGALETLSSMEARADTDAARACVADTRDRVTALFCWYRNQRNLAAWIAGVHGFLESADPFTRAEARALVRATVLDEMENTRALLTLWESSARHWMIVSGVGETTFVYGSAFGEQLKRKLALMAGRENDEPRIDPNYQWRVPGYPRTP